MLTMTDDYVTVRLARSTRDALQRLQLKVQAEAERRLTLSDVAMAAALVAEDHLSDVAAKVPIPPD